VWTGEWHKRTARQEKLRLGTRKVVLLPTATFTDKTSLDKLGRGKACPTTLPLLNYVQEIVASGASKKTFGYYPDVHLTREQRKEPAVKRAVKDLYSCVAETVLGGFVDLYKEGGTTSVDAWGETWHVVPVLPFVATGREEAQGVKGVYQGYSARTPCHLREATYEAVDAVLPSERLKYRCTRQFCG